MNTTKKLIGAPVLAITIALALALAITASFTACTGEESQNGNDQQETGQLGHTATKGYASVLDAERTLASYEVHPADAYELIQNEENNVKLIDVREQNEYDQSHIPGAILVPLTTLSKGALEANGVTETDFIIVYCSSGNRSAQAYQVLQSRGYYNVNSLAGGILEWNKNGYPVE